MLDPEYEGWTMLRNVVSYLKVNKANMLGDLNFHQNFCQKVETSMVSTFSFLRWFGFRD
jgi:hypothetical protein